MAGEGDPRWWPELLARRERVRGFHCFSSLKTEEKARREEEKGLPGRERNGEDAGGPPELLAGVAKLAGGEKQKKRDEEGEEENEEEKEAMKRGEKEWRNKGRRRKQGRVYICIPGGEGGERGCVGGRERRDW